MVFYIYFTIPVEEKTTYPFIYLFVLIHFHLLVLGRAKGTTHSLHLPVHLCMLCVEAGLLLRTISQAQILLSELFPVFYFLCENLTSRCNYRPQGVDFHPLFKSHKQYNYRYFSHTFCLLHKPKVA